MSDSWCPMLEGRPGVYRFTITEVSRTRCFYVGETDNLSRRMNNYRHPGADAANEREAQRVRLLKAAR